MAAVKVLTSKGYYSSTMDDIVKESQMSKGAIYHYYSSKKDVYLAVIDMWENQTQELLAPAANEDSSAKAIKKLFNLLAKQLKIDGSFFNCLPTLWAIARHDDDFKKKMQKVYNRFQRFIELIILRGIESKEFVNLKPDNAKAHNNLGNNLKELGRLDEAEAIYKEQIALKPDYAEAR